MSDRHAAEKLFSDVLSEYLVEILPDVVDGWSDMSNTEKEQLVRMNNFFCGLHFLVALANSAEATLKLWETTFEANPPASVTFSFHPGPNGSSVQRAKPFM